MMPGWSDPAPIEVPHALLEAAGGVRLVAEILARRGLTGPQAVKAFLDPAAYTPASPWDFPGMDLAVELLLDVLQRGRRILVWGDFDVDGQTSTTLLVSALRELGGEAIYHIPVRARESHGISPAVLGQILDSQDTAGVELLLTCDTGIAAYEGLALARARGLKVVVTDHHLLPERLPEADAILNPHLLPEGHQARTLPGAGIAYKLVEALFDRMGRPSGAEAYLDLVALAIVADVAAQTGDCRYLLQRGLELLRQNRRPGLQALFELNELSPASLNEETIGFLIGPNLNALGRLGDANSTVEFFTTGDLPRARVLALQLHNLNTERRLLTGQVYQGALALIEREPALLEEVALVLAHPAWPAGVVGIVASRLVERYQRPVILLTTPEGEAARGSARSVEGVDITAAIAAQSDLLLGFGGHARAAGLSLDPARIPEFRRRLSRTLRLAYGKAPAAPRLQIDAYLSLPEAGLELAEGLERLAPFGAGNPPPVLVCRDLSLQSQSLLGRSGEHLQLTVEDGAGNQARVLRWGAGEDAQAKEPAGQRFDLAFTLRRSDYRGQMEVQLTWVAARVLDDPAPDVAPEMPQPEVVDYRGQPQPLAILHALCQAGPVQVWAEGEARLRLEAQGRGDLNPCPTLVIWTAPPGRAELRQALDRVQPRQVVLFGHEPETATSKAFLSRLAGLVKYTLNQQQGLTQLSALAAATAQRELAVRLGLAWLEASGFLSELLIQDAQISFAEGQGVQQPERKEALAVQLEALLEEAAAFRAYFLRVEAVFLL